MKPAGWGLNDWQVVSADNIGHLGAGAEIAKYFGDGLTVLAVEVDALEPVGNGAAHYADLDGPGEQRGYVRLSDGFI